MVQDKGCRDERSSSCSNVGGRDLSTRSTPGAEAHCIFLSLCIACCYYSLEIFMGLGFSFIACGLACVHSRIGMVCNEHGLVPGCGLVSKQVH